MPQPLRFHRVIHRLYRRLLAPLRSDYGRYQRNLTAVYHRAEIPLLLTPYRLGPSRLVRHLEQTAPYHHVETRESTPDFQHYGHDIVLKRFGRLPRRFQTGVTAEHGCFFRGDNDYAENVYRTLPFVLTMGEPRVKFLSSLRIPAYAIGPYIHYASPPVSLSRIDQLKRQLGKTLVYFPYHSAEHHDIDRQHAECVRRLARLASEINIDSVIVCYYWRDYIDGSLPRQYASLTSLSACCGHRSNPFFLDHLKFLLSLSDATASNWLGTVSGYSAFLGKPHFLLACARTFALSASLRDLIPEAVRLIELLTLRNDASSSGHIEPEAEAIFRRVWGFDLIRSHHEITRLLRGQGTTDNAAEQ
jgi:hypothetical protein